MKFEALLHNVRVECLRRGGHDVLEELPQERDMPWGPIFGVGHQPRRLKVSNRNAVEVLRQLGLKLPFVFQGLPKCPAVCVGHATVKVG